MLKGLPIAFHVSDAGCTAFVSQNVEGDIIYARNFDFLYAPLLQIYPDKVTLNTIGVYDGETDKLQWSVVYNLTDKTGRIWPHRDSGKSWDFTVVQSY